MGAMTNYDLKINLGAQEDCSEADKIFKTELEGNIFLLDDLDYFDIEKIVLPHGFGEYEENHDFPLIDIYLVNGKRIAIAGYCGITEIICYNKLTDTFKYDTLNDIRGWIAWYLNEWMNDEVIEATDAVKAFIENWKDE
jgi:hypothetical protein